MAVLFGVSIDLSTNCSNYYLLVFIFIIIPTKSTGFSDTVANTLQGKFTRSH